MAALPNVSIAVAGAATEGDVKNHLSGVYAFLAGLFGTTGTAADARTALGVTPLTSGNVATALGYTPANLANAGSDHNHSGAYLPKDFGAGNYPIGLCKEATFISTSVAPGGPTSGINLVAVHGTASLPGTWRNLQGTVGTNDQSIWQRIA